MNKYLQYAASVLWTVAFIVGMYILIENQREMKVQIASIEANTFTSVAQSDLLLGLAVNERIQEKIMFGEEEEVYQFYDRYTRSREITHLLVSNALSFKIPIHYLIGLADTESGFNTQAVNGIHNQNGSSDYGLMQINSYTFKAYNQTYLMDPANNVRLASSYLLDRYMEYGNWYEALMSYNAGSTNYVPNSTVNHFVLVLEYATRLDVAFSKEHFYVQDKSSD